MPKIDETRPFLPVNIAVLTVSDTRSADDDTLRPTTYATRRSSRTTTAAAPTSPCDSSAASISPGSIRTPRSFT